MFWVKAYFKGKRKRDILYFARKRAGGIQRRKQKSTHMQKREERRDEGDLGFFLGKYEKDN